MKRIHSFRGAAVGLLLLILILSGCRTIPDLTPFANATAEIDLAANQTHDFVVADLDALAAGAPASTSKKQLAMARDAFSKEWKVRLAATEAMVDYADSLSGIAAAGEGGQESARALAGSVNNFLGAIPNVTAQLPAAAVDVAAWVKGEIDKVRAAESLADAINAANPLIREVAIILEKDFALVGSKIDSNRAGAHALLDFTYGERPAYREQLVKRQDLIAGKIRAFKPAEPIPTVLIQQSELVALLLAETEEWYEDYREKYDGATKRAETEKAIVRKAQEAVLSWAKVHGQLAEAINQKRMPSATTLANKAIELKELVEKLKGDE